MTRVLAFAVAFLAFTACHQDIKKISATDIRDEEHLVTKSVTTAPTERVTERWHFTITPGIGRALPAGDGASRPLVQREGAPFPLSPGLGYAVDEYERVTEHLEPVAKTTVTNDKNSEVKTISSFDKDTDIGPGWKFYLVIALVLATVVAVGYGGIKFNWLSIAKGLLKRVLG